MTTQNVAESWFGLTTAVSDDTDESLMSLPTHTDSAFVDYEAPELFLHKFGFKTT